MYDNPSTKYKYRAARQERMDSPRALGVLGPAWVLVLRPAYVVRTD
jgi:hypothetical protein